MIFLTFKEGLIFKQIWTGWTLYAASQSKGKGRKYIFALVLFGYIKGSLIFKEKKKKLQKMYFVEVIDDC